MPLWCIRVLAAEWVWALVSDEALVKEWVLALELE